MPDAIPALDKIRLVRMTSAASDGDATYALSRQLFFYTTGNSPVLQAFLDYVLSNEAQTLIIESGLYPAVQTDMTSTD
jgi:ABC-type phosphate transport system substrate-binding protein